MKRNCYDLKTSSIEKIFDSIIIIYILVLVHKNKKKYFILFRIKKLEILIIYNNINLI